ncbi:hypothetical protein BDP27DRAFT_275175 [Rhodocollybia butyracea]|uniref:Uncharacterized protein n=1 Tax=Rhodocollybia butyracea TaxID=206335 RepID=A0A9P5PIK3_9AGAR|nr:hypothetical protein BDP27DRAFT_275175 [Rhodocollybia butyracea]
MIALSYTCFQIIYRATVSPINPSRNMPAKRGRRKLETSVTRVTKMGRIRALESSWGTTVYSSNGSINPATHYVSYSCDGKRSVVPFVSSSLKRPLLFSPDLPNQTLRHKRICKSQCASIPYPRLMTSTSAQSLNTLDQTPSSKPSIDGILNQAQRPSSKNSASHVCSRG